MQREHSSASEMPNALFWIFCTVLTIEATLICLGNAFTIFVFWHQRASFKRAWYLLINLAVADHLVGLTVLTHMLTYKPSRQLAHADDIFATFFLLFATVSLLCLMVISLERVYAVLWPLRHRVASTRRYIVSIVLVWTGGFCTATIEVIKNGKIIQERTSNLFINSLFFTSLVVVLGAYLTIRKRLNSPNHLVAAQNRRTVEQNVKLSKSLFIVIGLSFSCWLPSIVVFITFPFCSDCERDILDWTTLVISLANSLVNPVVYCLKMPAFESSVRKLLRRNTRTWKQNLLISLMLGLSVKSFTKIEEFSTKSTPETLPNLCTAARKWIATIFLNLQLTLCIRLHVSQD